MCFGGMNSNEHADADAKRADAKWIEYPSDMGKTRYTLSITIRLTHFSSNDVLELSVTILPSIFAWYPYWYFCVIGK